MLQRSCFSDRIELLPPLQVLVDTGDMTGRPGSDPNIYSSAWTVVDLSPGDTVRDVKKRLISALMWTDETPEDFGLFDDISDEPVKDAMLVEPLLSSRKAYSGGKSIAGGGAVRRGASEVSRMSLPKPYIGLLWAARND